MIYHNLQKISGVIICFLTVVGFFRILMHPEVFGPFIGVINDLRVFIPLLMFLIPGIVLIMTKKNISITKSVVLLIFAVIMGVIFCGSFAGFAPTPVIIDILLLPFYLITAIVITLTSKKII